MFEMHFAKYPFSNSAQFDKFLQGTEANSFCVKNCSNNVVFCIPAWNQECQYNPE